MKKIKVKHVLTFMIMCVVLSFSLPSCGTMHSYWGVENDYYSDGYDHPHHHKRPKPPKPPKRHKDKHHHHHHHYDD